MATTSTPTTTSTTTTTTTTTSPTTVASTTTPLITPVTPTTFTTFTTTPDPNSDNCTESCQKIDKSWISGNCSKYLNAEICMKSCGDTCLDCDSEMTCRDELDAASCNHLKQSGSCFIEMVEHNCMKTCGACSDLSTTTPVATTSEATTTPATTTTSTTIPTTTTTG